MELRRRKFLGLVGAAAAAPLMPVAAPAAGAYSRASYMAAIAHAQKYPMVSIGGMVRWLGVNADQAEAILGDMDRAGLVSLRAKPSMRNGVHASSKILKGEHWGVVRTPVSQPAKPAKADKNGQAHCADTDTDPTQIDPLMLHLYTVCVSQGHRLAPRCVA